MKLEKPDFEPTKETLDYYDLKKPLTLKEIIERRKATQKDLDLLNKGSIWKPSSLFRGLLYIAFPDKYFGQTD